MPDAQDQQGQMVFGFRLEQAAKAVAGLKAKFPQLAARENVRVAELAILFETL